MTPYPITVGLSMNGTHYYENDVMSNQIFYRWPGAVHYTVYAQYCTPYDLAGPHGPGRITNGDCVKQFLKGAVKVLHITAKAACVVGKGIETGGASTVHAATHAVKNVPQKLHAHKLK